MPTQKLQNYKGKGSDSKKKGKKKKKQSPTPTADKRREEASLPCWGWLVPSAKGTGTIPWAHWGTPEMLAALTQPSASLAWSGTGHCFSTARPVTTGQPCASAHPQVWETRPSHTPFFFIILNLISWFCRDTG